MERGLPEWMWSEARGGDKVEGKVSAVMRREMMVKWENVSDDGGNIVMRGERGVVRSVVAVTRWIPIMIMMQGGSGMAVVVRDL